MKPSHKYWVFILGISGIIFGVICASVAGSWLSLTPTEQAYLIGLADRVIPFPLLGAFVLAAVIGGLVSLLFHYYIIPILKIAESTQLISLANAGHRIETKGAREIVHLAEIINSSAAAYQKLQDEVDSAIRSAQADLREERNRFAALVSELPTGVLACNIDGQILLYNQQAQTLLQLPHNGMVSGNGQGGLIGLGRSVFGLLQREPLLHGLERLQQAVTAGENTPTTRFMVPSTSGTTLQATMAPVFSFRCDQHDECLQCERRQMTGLVLTLEDSSAAHTCPSVPPVSPDSTPVESSQPAATQLNLRTHHAPRPVYYEFDLFHQPASEAFGAQLLRKLTYVAFDTETTGLHPEQGDEIIQIGAVRIVNGRILEDEIIDQLVDPERSIPESSRAIHGISRDMVAGQPTIATVLPHLHSFAHGAVLVAHNAAFDMRCIRIRERQSGVCFDNPVLDTLLLSSIVHPHQETHAIDGIAQRLDLAIVGRHTALGDAFVTAEVLLRLIPLLEAKGIYTLEDALNASKKSPFAKNFV